MLFKRVILGLFLLISVTFIFNNQVCIADDTALSAVGDNVGPYEGSPNIVLDKEIINLNVYTYKTEVEVTFYLRNEGKEETILVGFPDEEASSELKENENYGFPAFQGRIIGFKSFVEGKQVSVATKKQLPQKIVDDYPENYNTLWHVWPVKFLPKHTTVIKNTYWVENGTNVIGEKNFSYTLVTGAKWKGNIGSATINAYFKNGMNINDIIKEQSTKGMIKISSTQALWKLSNFEPKNNNQLGFFTIVYRRNFIPVIKSRNLTEKDIYGLSDWELKVLRNEIYARHGRKFVDESLRVYFEQMNWYKPSTNYSDNLLNTFEKRNAAFILQYEKKIGSKIIK